MGMGGTSTSQHRFTGAIRDVRGNLASDWMAQSIRNPHCRVYFVPTELEAAYLQTPHGLDAQ